MRKFVLLTFLLVSCVAQADDWALVSSDDASRTFLGPVAVTSKATDEVRFKIRQVHNTQKDMMGLFFNTTEKVYVLACRSRQMLFRQQFLLVDDEIVWSFPESKKVQKASLELSDEVLVKVCTR